MPKNEADNTTSGKKLLLLFLKLLLNKRRHFVVDLAREFQCSPNTINRLAKQIRFINNVQLATGFEGRKRWYQMTFKLCSVSELEYEELRYLALCRDLAGNSLPEPIRNRVNDSIFKLSESLAEQDAAKRAQVQHRPFAFFGKGRIDYAPHYKTLETLNQAIAERRFCFVRYKAAGANADKDHCFAPGRIVNMNGALYVVGVGMTEDFNTIRHPTTFAIHRIVRLSNTARRREFELPEADPGSFGLPWHEPKTFRVRFKEGKAADYVRERTWADKQTMEELDDGGLLLEITTRSEPEFMAWVRSFGEEAEMA